MVGVTAHDTYFRLDQTFKTVKKKSSNSESISSSIQISLSLHQVKKSFSLCKNDFFLLQLHPFKLPRVFIRPRGFMALLTLEDRIIFIWILLETTLADTTRGKVRFNCSQHIFFISPAGAAWWKRWAGHSSGNISPARICRPARRGSALIGC